MGTFSKQRIWIMVIVLVVLVAAAGVIFYGKWRGSLKGNGQALGGVMIIDPAQVPPGFPNGTPLFFQKEVLKNYTINVPEGTLAHRQFVASTTAPAVYIMYRDYFLQAGWDVVPQYDPKALSHETFRATKGGNKALVIVDPGVGATKVGASGRPTVTLDFFTKHE